MTDEEMAEEEYKNCKFEKIEHYCDKAIFVTGFLAGLKARNNQLTKSKEIIKKLKILYFSPVVTNDDVKRQDEILNEAEQFLKE